MTKKTENQEKKTKKKFGKLHSMEQTTVTELDKKKELLYKLVDSLTPSDYVSFTTSLENMTAKDTQKLYKIIIEINGNIHISPKTHPYFSDDD